MFLLLRKRKRAGRVMMRTLYRTGRPAKEKKREGEL